MKKLDTAKLKESLAYIESKQREVQLSQKFDNRSLNSIIKYLKNDMINNFRLMGHDVYIFK
ncbi:hypothetical protein [Flavobacterium sp. FlaQc-28]|uniref:hypothetical protein n=1 Tax=Flavobacterium sp. FlaQc-28 TaxID=3374178 RepID=UPI003756CF46